MELLDRAAYEVKQIWFYVGRKEARELAEFLGRELNYHPRVLMKKARQTKLCPIPPKTKIRRSLQWLRLVLSEVAVLGWHREVRRGEMTNPAKTCRRKKAYATVQAAGIRASMDSKNFKKSMIVYECEVCGKYHLSSRFFNTNTGGYEWPATS